MKKFLVLFFALYSILFSDTFPKKVSLDGKWLYHVEHLPHTLDYRYIFSGKESSMQLPNNWYKEGLNHAGIVWFEKSFNSKLLPRAKHHFINFEGVDYQCDIWVNSNYVGSHSGYFQEFKFDITPYLVKGINKIEVRVNSPLENYPEHYSLHKTLLRGIFSHHDTRAGGAWSAKGQDRNSGGIWNHISIESLNSIKLDNLKITPKILDNSNVSLSIDFNITKLYSSSKKSFIYSDAMSSVPKNIEIEVVPYNFKGDSYSKKFNFNAFGVHHLEINLPNSKLWSTHDRGDANLYTLKIKIDNTIYSQNIGLKSMVQDSNKRFILNGKSLYIKGTNYISSQYMSEMSIAKLRKDLELMRDAHINTIRVHAHIEPKRFYELCDEMGFLVWQDYNLQWGYIDNKEMHSLAIKEAKDMVDKLYNHASIFIWSMHNEPPWNSEWMKWKYRDYSGKENVELDDKLYTTISNYDSYHMIKKISSSLEHPWFGWYSGDYHDFAKDSKVAVVSEYGAQALPDYDSLKRILPKKYLKPKGKKAKKEWEYHNFQFNWNSKNGIEYRGDIKEFIKESQEYQASLIKFTVEMLRVQKYSHTTGIFQFMFNEGWPSMNWGIVDYYRVPKAGYNALKSSYAPVIVVAKQIEGGEVEIYVVNDKLQALNGAKVVARYKSGEHTFKEEFDISIPADSVVKVATLNQNSIESLDLYLKKKSVDIANNSYKFEKER